MGALVVHVHILDLDAVLGLGVAQEDHGGLGTTCHSRRRGWCCGSARLPGDPVVNRAPGEDQTGKSRDHKETDAIRVFLARLG